MHEKIILGKPLLFLLPSLIFLVILNLFQDPAKKIESKLLNFGILKQVQDDGKVNSFSYAFALYLIVVEIHKITLFNNQPFYI